MDLPPVGQPPAGVEIEALQRFLRAFGIVVRAQQALEGTPKPWPNSTKRARMLLSQALGMMKDAQRGLPEAVRTEVFKGVQTPYQVAGSHPARNDLRKQ